MNKTGSNNGNFWADMKRFFPLLKNLVSKDIKIKYRRSVLGIAWSVLNPLLTMLVITTVFGKLLRIQVENFATYYIVGYSMWSFFSEATSNSLTSILDSASLIKKVYIPKYIFPIEKCLFSLVNFAFTLIAVVIVMLFQGVTPSVTAILFPIPVAYCLIFVCGASLLLSAINVYFRDVQHLYGVFLTMLMYLTPIIYPMELLGDHAFIAKIVSANPITHYVEYFRNLIMYNNIPDLHENAVCLAMALGMFVVGVFTFKKAEDKFILHI